ncbi:MAG: NAD(P)H-dependent oxidoreductase [Candidatus Micrarchaeota archaeon]|nr:NAD(P)H-dependent oxidoreductase [Candidatus Micrarchaeota archaeon]
MEFKEIVMSRYAVKKFDGRKLPASKLNELMELIRFAPTSFNLQPYKVKVVSDQKTKDLLQKASWDQQQIGTSSHVLVFCADTNIAALIDKLEGALLKSGASEESIKGYVQMMRDFEKSMDQAQKLAWAQKQAYLALGNALNGSKALGFDSCPMEGFDPKEYSKILKLPGNLVPTVVCPVGYAADKPRPKIRFEAEYLFF